jgi:hypothetical protein
MQESEKREIAVGSAFIVRFPILIEPSLRFEFESIGAPEMR